MSLIALEAKLQAAVQKKYPGCTSTYMPDYSGYGNAVYDANDTPASIVIKNGSVVFYDNSTDFAEIIQEYRELLGKKLGRRMSKDHWLVTGKWA